MGLSRARLGVILACLLAIGLASSSASAIAGQGRGVSCRVRGSALYHHGSVRVILGEGTASDGLAFQIVYECPSRAGRPHVLFTGSEGSYTSADTFRRSGARLGFHIHIDGGTEVDDYLGWINTETNIVRYAHLGLALETAYAIAADGAIAAISGDGNQRVVLLIPYNQPARNHRSSRGRHASFGAPKLLFESTTGGVDPHFIQVTSSAVTWKTSQGMLTTVAR